MPVNAVYQGDKLIGYRMGQSGKLYTIKDYGKEGARYKALQQLRAYVINSKMKGGKE